MIIIWSGWGILVVVFAGAALVVGLVLDQAVGFRAAHPWLTGLAELLAAAGVWYVGVRLNTANDRTLLDPATGEQVVLRRRHTFFWIPMQYWAVLVAAGAVALFISAIRG
jgi:hypothetical protein